MAGALNSTPLRRRGFLTGLAAAVPTAVLVAPALAAEPDAELDALWRERTALCIEGARMHARREAHAKLPAWAAAGREYIDHEGKPCGDCDVGWPVMQDVQLPPHPGSRRRVRVSGYEAVERLRHPEQRAKVRARYRERMRKFIALRRAQKCGV